MLRLFAACAPGLEPLLAHELRALGLQEIHAEAGGVAVRGDARAVATICLHSGLANHLRLRVGEPFDVRHFDKLVRKTAALPWSDVLRPGTNVEVRAVCRKSRLYHSDAVAQRVHKGIERAVGRGNEGGPQLEVVVRIVRDRCTISLDLSGEALHRRGWRRQTAKAPLREDLARALLISSGWNATTALLDPMVGAGTIVIEAATMARKLAPGLGRNFAFERTRLAERAELDEQRELARRQALPQSPVPILGRDHKRGAIEATQANATRAGVLDDLTLSIADISKDPWPDLEGAHVVTNPPYGLRVGKVHELHALYEALGQAVREHKWSLGVVIADRRFVRTMNAGVVPRLVTDHGGIKIEFFATAAG